MLYPLHYLGRRDILAGTYETLDNVTIFFTVTFPHNFGYAAPLV